MVYLYACTYKNGLVPGAHRGPSDIYFLVEHAVAPLAVTLLWIRKLLTEAGGQQGAKIALETSFSTISTR